MNTLVKVLNQNLNALGYNESVISAIISKIDISLIENNLKDVEDYSEYVDVFEYDEPCVEIIRAFLNINNEFIQTEIIEGDLKTFSAENAFRTRFVAADYSLNKRNAVIAVSNDFRVKIYIYAPTQRAQILYEGRTYEESYKKDRDAVTLDYKDAFERNKRLPARKIEEILSMLVSDYIIDEMVVYNLNPKLKMYDDPRKYAENITTYSLRFINNKTNRIEIYEREPVLRRIGNRVRAGICSNDPYIRLDEMPAQTDFLLNEISYYWLKSEGKKQDEIAIYTADRQTEYETYVELKKNSPSVKLIIDDVVKTFKRTVRVEEDYSGYISEVIKSLNIELVDPSTATLKEGLENITDSIIPISYRYRFVSDPKEFEEKLYVSIEDNIGKEYKYKITESIMEDLTRIGNKLEYTDEKGELVRRQSVADFNVNAPTAIIRKETFISEDRIPDLLGYIYEDLDSYGTEKLPIPSIYVDIYIPKIPSTTVSMYNGTSLDFTLDGLSKNKFFYSTDSKENGYIEGGAALPGSTYVTVRYVNSKDEILKENRIGNLFPNSTFVPEILPIINDVQGREWRAELTRIEPLVVQSNPEQNVIKLKYVERFTRVNFSFINREGKKIADDKQEIVQVGENYNFDSKKSFIAKDNDEWSLKFTRPSKFIAKDDEEKNKVILVYDIERTDILIKYLNKNNEQEIAESKRITVAANKKYAIDVPKFIRDSSGLGWNYIEGTNTNVLAQRDTLNEVNLYYTEAKVPVTITFKNDKNIKLIDDKIELVQIGKKYSFEFDDEITDFQCREWVLKSESKSIEIVVAREKEKNIIEAVFEPVLANVTIRFLNTDDRAIKSDEIEKAQIGEEFNSESLEEITDNFGKAWKCISKSDKIIVKSKEIENVVILKYEPLMAKVTVKYLDSETNELMEPRYETLQVGSSYKNKPIEKFTSKDGKRWKVDYNKIESIIVKKYDEENIYSIYYDKENAKVTLTFFDAYNNELKDSQVIESQIGAEVETKVFEKITDRNGQRWMIETSEPKKLIVRENNNSVKLIYGEVKSKVLVKHIDVRTQQAIVENIMTTVKLGGIYVPNIQTKILDKNKYQWKYIGDENISIVTKENEQENIIVLNYEQDRAKVILKYRNTKDEKIREDAVKEVQIGKEIRIDPIQKFNDNNGLMWKFASTKMNNKIVEEKDNIILATYEPVIADIKIRYVDSNGASIIDDKIIKMQVGKEFVPEIIDRVTSKDNRIWVYNKISAEKIVVKEDHNDILMTFEKLMQNISVQFVDEEGVLIADPNVFSKQVGEIFKIPYEAAYQDAEEKAWLLVKSDAENITTSELEEKNIVKVWYKKELVDVQLKYLNDAKEIIRDNTTEKVQIGSIYKPTPFKEIIDGKTKLGWKLPDDYKLEYKVKRNPAENILETEYEKLKVKVAVRYKDAKDMEIIEETIYSEQVGTTFTPKVEQEIKDKEDKEWLYGLVEESRLFAGARNKVDSIVVARDESKNFIDLRYRPWLIKVTIRYQEPLGNLIRQDTEVDAQIGSVYESEIIETIQDKQKVKWVYNPNSKPSLKVTHEEKENVIILGYEEEKALVTYKYHDEYGNRLRSPKRKLVQIGSLYEPEVENVIEDFQGKFWEYKAKSIDKLEIKDDESTNIVEVIYMPLKVDTILRFVNPNGKQILKDATIKAQLGSEFTPDIQEKITDEESKLFKYIKCEPESLKIQEIPIGAIETPNVFELTYEAVFSEVRVTYKTIDGKQIKEDEVTQIQVGTIFDPVLAQYIKDEEGIQWELISKDVDSIRIKEDVRENIVAMVYEVAKAEVTVRYKDLDGNTIRKSDIIPMEVGKEFIPQIEDEIIDENNKKWTFSMADPVKLTVGSINNIINLTYQEKKVSVLVKYQTKDGKQLKEDFRAKVQIGIRYEPKNTTKVIYNENEIWRFVYNEPSVIVVSENASENVITQVYTKEEREEEKKVETGTYYNPEVEKFIDENLVQEAQKQEEQQKIVAENNVEEKVEFQDEKLKGLEKSISLKAQEKLAINKLNKCNDETIKKLNDAINQGGDLDYAKFDTELNEILNEEKKIIQDELSKLIEDDRTGRLLLKIFEAITSSEMGDKNFYVLQQRKTILVADYFINKQITEMEQANYICDRGIVEKAIECIEQKYSAPMEKKDKNRPALNAEYLRIRIVLTYEKALINNFNKARSKVKDEYFKNEESKSLVPPEVVIIVANTLPKQAYKLLTKVSDLSIMKENELEAILKLMNTQQLGTLMAMVEKIPDGKIRKAAIRKIKDITG